VKATAVIVTYHPDLPALTRLLEALAPQVASAIIVDNGSPENLTAFLASRAHPTETLLPLGENLGIAAAQNRGIAGARVMGAEAVILFDQDSLPEPDMVGRLVAALGALAAEGRKVAAVGPRPVDARLGRRSTGDGGPGRGPVPVDHLIASGCLMPMAALDAVGPLREELFIDYVDIEWCLRAASLGFGCYRLDTLAMAHEFGSPVDVLGRSYVSHTPMRHYYLFRNTIWMWRRRALPWRWRLRMTPRLLLRLGFNVIFARPHRQQWRLMLRGLADGFASRMGKGHE
jgi:rhamnosyltransferase